jgi:hypothetical protein
MASSGTTSTKTRFTGAQLIVHLLERQGITTVAGIPGGTVLPLYDALSQSTQIRHVLARHEQGRALSLRAWRVRRVNRRSVWPAAARAHHQPGHRHRRRAPRLHSADLHYRPGAVLDDRYRCVPGSGYLRHLYPHHQT